MQLMHLRTLLAVATSAALSVAAVAAFAGADKYVFEPVQAGLTKGDDVTVAVCLLHKPSKKPVADAIIFRTPIDMGPDGMAEMVSPVTSLPSSEPGIYQFRTDLPMAGQYPLQFGRQDPGRT